MVSLTPFSFSKVLSLFIPDKSKLKLGLLIPSVNNSPIDLFIDWLKAISACPVVISAISCLTLMIASLSFIFWSCASFILWAADKEACWLITTAAPFNNCPILDLFSFVGNTLVKPSSVIPKSCWNCFATLVNSASLRLLNSGFNSHKPTWDVLPWDRALLPSSLNFLL